MKCKAACAGLPDDLVTTLDGLRPVILERVVGPHLHRPNISSAGFYVQMSDHADNATHEPFCEVRLSGVSITEDRSVKDFRDARGELERIYKTAIRDHLRAHYKPGERVALFVVLMLDGPPKPGMSSMFEGDEIFVEGR